MKHVRFSGGPSFLSATLLKRSSTLVALLLLLLLGSINGHAQVKIGNNPNTINTNSLLELESTNKGFLPPRIAINDLNAVAPLTGTVPAGMLVYSTGGTVADGYYFWNGSAWASIGQANMVTKTANATIQKTETFILASNDITLTLPAVTGSTANGLSITVKNIGSSSNLVTVTGGTATIDGSSTSALTRWQSKTYVAYNGNWLTKEKESGTYNILEVSPNGSWVSIEEAIDFLDVHMTGPSIIRLSGDEFQIDASITINLPFPVTIQGASFGKTVLIPGAGLAGPIFKAQTECYFKMLAFDAGATYSNTSGNDAIQFETAGEYFEVKDCNFEGFNKALVAETAVELWVFETDFNNARVAGIEIASAVSGVTLKVSEVDFISCAKGISLESGTNAIVSILNSTFYNASGGIGINYNPATFLTFSSMFITNNAWNSVGSFFNGFDFSRADGRDARAFIQNNAGDPNRNPNCYINVLNSTTTTTLTNAGLWYKAAWNYLATTVNTTKWTVANAAGAGNVNRITYQPTNKRSGYFMISGNILCNNAGRTLSISVFRNNNTTVRFGEITIRTGNANTPTVFSTIVYLPDISNGDFFEIGLSTTAGGDIVTLQDVQWLAETK